MCICPGYKNTASKIDPASLTKQVKCLWITSCSSSNHGSTIWHRPHFWLWKNISKLNQHNISNNPDIKSMDLPFSCPHPGRLNPASSNPARKRQTAEEMMPAWHQSLNCQPHTLPSLNNMRQQNQDPGQPTPPEEQRLHPHLGPDWSRPYKATH